MQHNRENVHGGRYGGGITEQQFYVPEIQKLNAMYTSTAQLHDDRGSCIKFNLHARHFYSTRKLSYKAVTASNPYRPVTDKYKWRTLWTAT